ncbi:Fur family transcriptional regulator [Hoyosella subflava]|uniref:Fur family transcriptional regulator n=1 Tax=Hoyosella subflava TaxID=639313 RepID=UPI00059B6DB6|nr:Fur family transcriptional regulator [Hoyosella subflava]
MPTEHLSGEPRNALREAGLRVTAPRVAVLTVLAAAPHSTADEVATKVRAELGSVSTQAVYDVLKACVAAGLVRRIEPAGFPALYETRAGDNHHHFVCRSCGNVADVDCVAGAAPCLTPQELAGRVIDEAEIVFWGLCAECGRGEPETAIASGAARPENSPAHPS